MQVNFMSSQQVWPQLAAPPVSELQSQLQSQPLLQAARGGYPDGSFGPLALGPLAAPLHLAARPAALLRVLASAKPAPAAESAPSLQAAPTQSTSAHIAVLQPRRAAP